MIEIYKKGNRFNISNWYLNTRWILGLIFALIMGLGGHYDLKAQNTMGMMKKKGLPVLSKNLVIAHRGTTYWAPEETEAAMRWARNIGADYLEFDLQRTQDGYLIALHDDKLLRTTDVALKFPDRKDAPVSSFTYEELLSLDAGSWFNIAYPDRARRGFRGLDILLLEDIVQIAEGNRIKRDESGQRVIRRTAEGRILTEYEKDPADSGNRPGIYVETKVPALFPNIEEDLCNELVRLGWYHLEVEKLKKIEVFQGKIAVANTPARVILQTFSKESLASLQKVFKRPLPTCFLLWLGDGIDDLPSEKKSDFKKWIEYGQSHGATIIGPSIGGIPNNYKDLLSSSNAQMIHKLGMEIHAYSFDTQIQMEQYGNRVEGMFTNLADLTLVFYGRLPHLERDPSLIWKELGY
jgi:glycerophosphoryl diester phosphodiesterase